MQNKILLLKQIISLMTELLRLKGLQKTLLQHCTESLGVDASPADLAPDELGCVETVTNILKKKYFNTPILTYTPTLLNFFEQPQNGYVRVTVPTPETIIICATEGGRPFPGHVGFFMEDMMIASNDSYTGKFIKNYTYKTWTKRWVGKGGYKIHLFKHV